LVLKHRAMMAQRREHDVGGTPTRSEQVRPRPETAGESEMDFEEDDDDHREPPRAA
jgi:hypothetical protein